MATQDLNQVPPEAEVWEADGKFFLVWYAPKTEPPVPLAWKVQPDDVEALGINRKKVARKFKTMDDFHATGVLRHGNSRELINTSEHPFDQILSNYKTEVKVKPWLKDPEIMGLWAAAMLEGRSITDAELHGTDWWQTHSESERQWLSLNASDPSTAEQLIQDNRIRVADLFRIAGVDDISQDLVRLVADNWTQGKWTEVYATKQIELLADPYAEGTLDSELTDFQGIDQTQEAESEVRQMFRDWLGPAFTRFVDRDSVERWAGRLRNNPDSRVELEQFLGRQFRTHFNPGGEVYGPDSDLRYSDVAPMWRNVWQQTWGQAPDETSTLFTRLIRLNDLDEAQKLLRKEGMRRNVGRVSQEARGAFQQAFGDQVRRADQAVI